MANTALLMMDVQKGVVGRVRDDHYVPRLAQAAKAARDAGDGRLAISPTRAVPLDRRRDGGAVRDG